MDSRQHDSSSALAIVSFTASLVLHAGAVVGFAYVNPRSHVSSGTSASDGTSVLLSLASAPPLPPPEPPNPVDPPKASEPPKSPPESPPTPVPEPPRVEEDMIRPGIDESMADTPNWLGFDRATPHSGVRSTVEQSALSPNPGMPLPLGVRAPQGDSSSAPAATSASQGAVTPKAEMAPAEPAKPSVSQATSPVVMVEHASEPAEQVKRVPAETMKEAEGKGDGKPLAPKVPVSVGPERRSEAPPSSPRDGAGEQPKVEPLASKQAEPTPTRNAAATKVAGVADGVRGATDDREREGVGHRTDDPRSIDALEQRKPLEQQVPAQVMPRPEAPAEGQGPAPLPAAAAQGEVVKGEREANKPASVSTPADVAASSSAPPASANPGSSQPQGVTASGTAPGEKSDAESIAAALEEAIDVKPGKVLAAKGLQVQTVRPEWSVATRLMSSPRNPVVKITFGRSGKVIKAEFVEGQTTGWPDVDGPLKDALYRWTAKGAALSKLPPAPPPGPDGRSLEQKGLSLTFRVILRNETPLER